MGYFFSAWALGCGGGGEAPASGTTAGSPATSGTAAAAPGTAAATGTAAAGAGCASIGCGGGKGDAGDKCDCKGKGMTPPLTATWQGKLDSVYKSPLFDVENTSDKDVHWASVSVYYYDQSGKQIEVKLKGQPDASKMHRAIGSKFTFKPKEKKAIPLGWGGENHPKEAVKIEAVFDGWCYGPPNDEPNELCITIERAPGDRPPSN